MKELRAFFEMTGLSLLPLLVLFLAVCGPLRPAPEPEPADRVRAETAAPSPEAAGGQAGEGVPRAMPASPVPEAPDTAEETSAPLREAAEIMPLPAPEPAGEEYAPEPAGEGTAPEREEAAPEPSGGELAEGSEPEAAAVFAPALRDAEVTVDILFGSRTETMSLRDYLLGVVAAEMPASFEPAALEAQAVAARTDTLYRLLVARPHPGAACCTDPGCCKAYLGPEELRRRWGEDYDRWAEKIAGAVDATDGVILTWEGKPIFAAFHACSQGRTEASENVWTAALPYLRSVPTGETAADVPSFLSTVCFGTEELRSLLTEKVPGAALPEEPGAWFTGERRSESGRLLSVEAGGVTLSGSALRRLLGLRSTAVTWRVSEGVFTFESAGYGHGVGMSQYGAEVMARQGGSWQEILLHYYSGASFAGLEEVFPG